MQKSKEESLQGYLERFLYNYQKTKQFSLDIATVRTVFLKGVRDDFIEVLNLMIFEDVYQNPFADIVEYCKRYSCSQSKIGKIIRDPTNIIVKPTSGGVTRIEMGNILEKFKTYILNIISSQLDTMKIKIKQEEENVALAIFFHQCRRKHPEKECPLNVIEIYGLYIEENPTNKFHSLPGLKAMFKGGEEPETSIQNIEVQTFPTYGITPAPLNGIELRSGRVVNKTNPTMVIQEEQVDNHTNQEEKIDVQMVQREERMTNPLNE
jgi:hypothetical protein